MPRLIDRLIAAFARPPVAASWSRPGAASAATRSCGPVSYFPAMQGVTGDIGARQLILQHADAVAEVEAESDATLIDIDTPEALAAYAEAGR